MIIDAYKTINELEELRRTYHDDLRQLDELCAHLHTKCSMLMELGDDEGFCHVAEITHSSFRDIEIVMQKLQKAFEGTSALIQKYQTYMDTEQNFAELLGGKP